jgi:hypothetical protein
VLGGMYHARVEYPASADAPTPAATV